MAFKKREGAPIIDSAGTRLSAMEQIDTNQGVTIDYGSTIRGALTATTFKAKLLAYDAKLRDYNQFLEQADATANELDEMETDIGSDYTAVLKSAVGEFGENASEIEMLGGTRKTERKKPTAKKSA